MKKLLEIRNACFKDALHRFIKGTRLDEYYRCTECSALRVIRVR
jgi:hypothetical protein